MVKIGIIMGSNSDWPVMQQAKPASCPHTAPPI